MIFETKYNRVLLTSLYTYYPVYIRPVLSLYEASLSILDKGNPFRMYWRVGGSSVIFHRQTYSHESDDIVKA